MYWYNGLAARVRGYAQSGSFIIWCLRGSFKCRQTECGSIFHTSHLEVSNLWASSSPSLSGRKAFLTTWDHLGAFFFLFFFCMIHLALCCCLLCFCMIVEPRVMPLWWNLLISPHMWWFHHSLCILDLPVTVIIQWVLQERLSLKNCSGDVIPCPSVFTLTLLWDWCIFFNWCHWEGAFLVLPLFEIADSFSTFAKISSIQFFWWKAGACP